MNIGDRMKLAGPLWKAMYERTNLIINTLNELRAITIGGSNPHKVNDTTNVIAVAAAAGGDLDSVIDLQLDMDTKYAAHLGSTTHHLAADVTNTLTDTTVYADIKALADELKVDYDAHRVMVGSSEHALGADITNDVTAADVSNKATAFALVNDIQTQFNAHCALASVTGHTAADTTNPVSGDALDADSTWEEIRTRLDALRAAYEAHRVLTTDSVHGAADSTNTVTATAVGAAQTSVNTYLNEIKGDFNAHIKEVGTSHAVKDESDEVTVANASGLATSVKLVNTLRTNYNDHISRAGESAGGAIPTLDEG